MTPAASSDPPGDRGGAARMKAIACLGGVSLERGVPLEEIRDILREVGNVVWVDVRDAGDAEASILEEEFGFHPLALEGATQGQPRPKLDEYKAHLLLVTCAAIPGGPDRELCTTDVSLFIGRNYVVSVHRGPVPALDEAAARWTRGGPRLRDGLGFLVYTVLDALLDSYVPLIEEIEDEIGETEIAMLGVSDDQSVRRLLRLKRTLVELRRVLHPLRDIFQVLLRRDHAFFVGDSEVYLRDVSNRVLRLLDVLETQREMAAGALEASLTVSSNRLNQTMKTLAVITVSVAVVASVFGAYGMNFETLPLAREPWGFWVVSAGTIAAVVAALLFGRARRWW
jgi:magnesium transporter